MSYQKYYVKDVKEKSSEKLFNVISCFAGGGGSSTGYRLAGANILLIKVNYKKTSQSSKIINKFRKI